MSHSILNRGDLVRLLAGQSDEKQKSLVTFVGYEYCEQKEIPSEQPESESELTLPIKLPEIKKQPLR